MSDERRRSPRVDVVGRVQGHAVTLNLPVKVREISLGGMSIETPAALELGTVHQFSLALGDGSIVVISGCVRYRRPLSEDAASPLFLIGLEFVEDDPGGESPVGGVLRRIT